MASSPIRLGSSHAHDGGGEAKATLSLCGGRPVRVMSPMGVTDLPRMSSCGSGVGGGARTFSRLTYSRHRLRNVAIETMQIADRGAYVNGSGNVVSVADDLSKAMANTVHYHFSHDFPSTPSGDRSQGIFDTKFHVLVSSSLEAALQFKDDPDSHVGVLNSASGKVPGGRFKQGTISQEDCLCRASCLYPTIAQFEKKEDHFYVLNNALPKGSSTSCAIFSPLVPVIRRDTVEANLVDDPQLCSFVTIPAPNAFILSHTQEEDDSHPDAEVTRRELREAMTDRIFRALSIFAERGCNDLVLSAFGCGVHGNDPLMVATIFRDQLLSENFRGRFRNVVFAIQPSRVANYKAFTVVFKKVTG